VNNVVEKLIGSAFCILLPDWTVAEWTCLLDTWPWGRMEMAARLVKIPVGFANGGTKYHPSWCQLGGIANFIGDDGDGFINMGTTMITTLYPMMSWFLPLFQSIWCPHFPHDIPIISSFWAENHDNLQYDLAVAAWCCCKCQVQRSKQGLFLASGRQGPAIAVLGGFSHGGTPKRGFQY